MTMDTILGKISVMLSMEPFILVQGENSVLVTTTIVIQLRAIVVLTAMYMYNYNYVYNYISVCPLLPQY